MRVRRCLFDIIFGNIRWIDPQRGWELLENGELIRKAEEAGYEFFATTDQSILYQQNLTGSQLEIVVLLATAWSQVRRRTEEIRAAIATVRPGEIIEVPMRME